MSFYQKSIFYECYKIIENFNRSGYWHCLCNLYAGCQTKKGFIMSTRRYCPVCQFEGTYDLNELNHVKKDLRKLQTQYYDILGQIFEVKKNDGTNDFWEEEVCYEKVCLKINRKNDFLSRLSSSNPVNWPESEFYPNENPAWYSQNAGILFHACMECMEDLFKITAAANNIGTCDVIKRTCRSVDQTWHLNMMKRKFVKLVL